MTKTDYVKVFAAGAAHGRRSERRAWKRLIGAIDLDCMDVPPGKPSCVKRKEYSGDWCFACRVRHRLGRK